MKYNAVKYIGLVASFLVCTICITMACWDKEEQEGGTILAGPCKSHYGPNGLESCEGEVNKWVWPSHFTCKDVQEGQKDCQSVSTLVVLKKSTASCVKSGGQCVIGTFSSPVDAPGNQSNAALSGGECPEDDEGEGNE